MAEPIGTGHPLGCSDWLRDGHGTRQGPGEALRFLPCGFGEETRAGSFRVRGGGRARPGDADLPVTGSRSLSAKPAPPEPAARGCSRGKPLTCPSYPLPSTSRNTRGGCGAGGDHGVPHTRIGWWVPKETLPQDTHPTHRPCPETLTHPQEQTPSLHWNPQNPGRTCRR